MVSAIIFIAALFLFYYFSGRNEFSGKDKSIAVLPFINLNGGKADEYFSDGMTENIITQLNKIEDLRVVSRASVIGYKGSKKSLRQIADELHVEALITGGVKKSGDNLSIHASLVDVNSGKTIWSDVYDKDIKDIFFVQNDLVQNVTKKLKAGITGR